MGNRMFYGTVLLTAANLALRLVSMGFQVWLSGQIGPGGIGLIQLVSSVSGLALTIGAAGSRAASTYLTAGAIGRGRGSGAVVSGCLRYALCFALPAAAGLWVLSPYLAETWVGDTSALASLRLYALVLPIGVAGGVLSGGLTAAGRVRELVAADFLGQGCAIAVTAALLTGWTDPAMASLAVAAGNAAAACLTLLLHARLLRLPRDHVPPPYGQIVRTALPLGLAGVLRSGLNTLEHLLIPKSLAQFAGTADAMADYGVLHGMAFPLLMLPAALLYALAELLTPELGRRTAANRPNGARHLVRRGLKTGALLGLAAGGAFFVWGPVLGERLLHSAAAGACLRLYAPFVPMLYLDAVVDAMNRGLGQQNANARYNLMTSLLDILLLRALLPRWGMGGYYACFAVTHLFNFVLSLGRLRKVSGVGELPLRAAVCTAAAAALAMKTAPWWYPAALALLWLGLGVVDREDARWLRGLAAGRGE